MKINEGATNLLDSKGIRYYSFRNNVIPEEGYDHGNAQDAGYAG